MQKSINFYVEFDFERLFQYTKLNILYPAKKKHVIRIGQTYFRRIFGRRHDAFPFFFYFANVISMIPQAAHVYLPSVIMSWNLLHIAVKWSFIISLLPFIFICVYHKFPSYHLPSYCLSIFFPYLVLSFVTFFLIFFCSSCLSLCLIFLTSVLPSFCVSIFPFL